MIKLLAVDMDGTCLNEHGRISKNTLDALKRAKDAGIIIVPTTGRAFACLPFQMRSYNDLYSYVITSNGAVIRDTKNNKDLYRRCIPDYMAEYFLEECESLRVGITAHVRNDYWIQGNFLHFVGSVMFRKDVQASKKINNIRQFISEKGCSVEEIQLYFLPGCKTDQIRKILKKYPELNAAYTNHYVEIFDRNTSKGNALKVLMEHLNLKKDEVACIGDSENDISMFDVAGVKIAMGNAIDDLKVRADFIVKPNSKDGVVDAIDSYILKVEE